MNGAASQEAASAEETSELPVQLDGRTYRELSAEFESATEAAMAGRGEPERVWFDQTSARLAESRRRWEEEVRLMREQFFSGTGRPEGVLKERAAALLDAHTFDQLHTRTARRPDGRLGHRVRLDLRSFVGGGGGGGGGGSEAASASACAPRVSASVPAKGPPRRVIVKVSGGDGGGRELVRTVGLPAGCLPGSLVARVTSDGVLLIDAVMDESAIGGGDCADVAQAAASPPQSPQPRLQAASLSSIGSCGNNSGSGGGGGGDDAVDDDETPRVVQRADGLVAVRLQFRLGGGYRPEEVRVHVSDARVRVTARHEERTRGRSFFREFQRDCDLPDGVDPDGAAASLTTGGLLIVEAPLVGGSPSGENGGEETPVTVTGGPAR